MSQELGTFTPYQYSGNKKDGKGQRMAGDMLKDFTQGNVAKVLGATGNKDYRNGVENEKSAYQPTVDKASNSNVSTNASSSGNSKAPQVSKSSPASQSPSGWKGQTMKGWTQNQEQADARAAQQKQLQTNQANRAAELSASYEPGKYQYYESEFGSGTGADAYGKDMAKYESMVAQNNGDGLAAGHLGLVSQMMHPDWAASQKTGGGNPIIEQDHSKPKMTGRQQYEQKINNLKSRIKPHS